MVRKNITINIEAYRRLKSVKGKNETFSQVIKRTIRPPFDFDSWLKKIEKIQTDSKFVSAVEAQIAHRRRQR